LSLARGKYQGFNDSPLTDKLRDEENLLVSRETVRRILRAAKLASPQKRRPRKYRSRRPSRPRFGMMALTDASSHDWLQGRGPELTLTGFQDDATHKILAADFQREAENTLGYLRCLRTLITTHGIPLSLYRDRHSIFQRNDAYWTLEEQLAGKQSPTQLGRALEELGIQKSPPIRPKPRAASSAPGVRFRTVWSANSASLTPPLWSTPTLCSLGSAPTTTSASPRPPATLLPTFAPFPVASISPAASAWTAVRFYDETTDSFQCPGQQRLPRQQVQKDRQRIVYAAKAEVCGACPLKKRCTQSTRRTVRRHCYEDARQRMQQRATPAALRLRRSTVEPPLATLKYRIFGNPRFLLRGRAGAQTEISLAVAIYKLEADDQDYGRGSAVSPVRGGLRAPPRDFIARLSVGTARVLTHTLRGHRILKNLRYG
jgi:hypothetical protein